MVTTYEQVEEAFRRGQAVPTDITVDQLQEVLDVIPEGKKEALVDFILVAMRLAA